MFAFGLQHFIFDNGEWKRYLLFQNYCNHLLKCHSLNKKHCIARHKCFHREQNKQIHTSDSLWLLMWNFYLLFMLILRLLSTLKSHFLSNKMLCKVQIIGEMQSMLTIHDILLVITESILLMLQKYYPWRNNDCTKQRSLSKVTELLERRRRCSTEFHLNLNHRILKLFFQIYYYANRKKNFNVKWKSERSPWNKY